MANVIGADGLQRRLVALTPKGLGRVVMSRLANRVVREAKIRAPRRTSNLSRTIHVLDVTDVSAVVVASADYAEAVEFGTKPHEIRPVRRKALRWAAEPGGARLTGTPRKATQRGANGGVAFARVVRHPGTRAQPFLRPGAQEAIEKERLMDEVVASWDRAD